MEVHRLRWWETLYSAVQGGIKTEKSFWRKLKKLKPMKSYEKKEAEEKRRQKEGSFIITFLCLDLDRHTKPPDTEGF